MLFNSFSFLLFFPIVALLYYVIPQKIRYIWLLFASYYFYMNWNAKYALLLAFSTFITYIVALLLSHFKENKQRMQLCLTLGFIANLLILFYFKYIDFAFDCVNRMLSFAHLSLVLPSFDPILPVGISFYTFQALSYIVDVYRGEIQPERNPLKYALYVSFFPQLVAGPIERSSRLLPQIQQPSTFQYDKARKGLFLMLLGYFEKIIIAERCCLLVDAVYDNYLEYDGSLLFIATVLFAFQIYCDFSGYSHIAIGCANVLGFDLMDNFHQPYFAKSIQDFWRRWHISLSTWFRDYLYIPLGGSRNGRFIKYRNLMITFLTSGLWHGASLHFVVWGGIHAIYQIIGDLTKPYREKLINVTHLNKKTILLTGLQIICCNLFIYIAWIFFRAPGLRDACYILSHIPRVNLDSLQCFDSVCSLMGGLNHVIILLLAIVILLFLDILHENDIWIYKALQKLPGILRWIIYPLLTLPVLLQAIYSFGAPASNFIYFQF